MKRYNSIAEIKADVDKGITVYHSNSLYEVRKMNGKYIVWCPSTSFSGGVLELYQDKEWLEQFYSD